MKSMINYDFELSKAVSMALQEIADDLDKATSQKLSDDVTQLNTAWQGENAREYTAKYKALMKQYKQICNNICKQSEELDRLSKRLFLEEQKAKEIAQKRDYGVD
ncbi:MAG: WXG100 family type VII secretion target [Ruminococcus sp.]|nr:WXG100 family type VII secretion target [Ruminococcus sp.]